MVNFFILGGPKCGTTAMVNYLRTHPDIFMSDPKEPNFFMDDMPQMKYVKTIDDYHSLFNNFKDNYKIYCDASILYLYSENAIKKIFEYNKKAKLIVMLRNPLEMVYSFHSQILYTMDEDKKNFKDAWIAEKNRRKGRDIPKYCRTEKLLFYSEIAKYHKQLKRVLSFFPKEQLKIIFYYEFKKSNLEAYKDVLNFLELQYDGRIDFPKVNKAKKAKFDIINKFVQRPPKLLNVTAKSVLSLINKPRFGLLEKIDKLNRGIDDRKELDQEIKHQILEEYRNDIKSLEALTNRKLNNWMQ